MTVRFSKYRFAVYVLAFAVVCGATVGVVAAQQGANTTNTTTNVTSALAPPDNATGVNNSSAVVSATIRDFKRAGEIPWNETTAAEKQRVRRLLGEMATQQLSTREQGEHMGAIKEAIIGGGEVLGIDTNSNPEAAYQIEQIIQRNMQVEGGVRGYGSPSSASEPIWADWNIPSLMDVKLRSLGDAFMGSVPATLAEVYHAIWSTPVPENSGWRGIMGTPTNFPFEPLYTELLEERVYPVMTELLGIAVLVLAGSVMVNPFISRYRAWDLFIKFVSGVALYAFAWTFVTLLHGSVDGIITFILPKPETIMGSNENLLSMAGAPVALYLFGSGGLFATLFALGLEFWFRHVLLGYVLPYVFGALALTAYIAPHGRLRKFASMGIWQHINVLTWPIGPALILAAIIAVDWNFRVGEGGIAAAFVIIVLFLCMIAIPIAQTWFFLQVPDMIDSRVSASVSNARGRMASATDRLPSGFGAVDTSATDATATDGGRPGERAAQMVESADATAGRSLSSSGRLDSTGSRATTSEWGRLRGDTTAAKIRTLHQQNRGSNMTAEAMKAEYFDRSLDNRLMADGGSETYRHITNR